jgi:hypothetical protein
MKSLTKNAGLDGAVAIVTGGATGIGAAIIETFVHRGSYVLFLDINSELIGELVARLEPRAKIAPEFVYADLRDVQLLKSTIGLIQQRAGPVRVLVNNVANDETHLWMKIAAFGIVSVLFRINHIDARIAAAFLGRVFAVYWRKEKRRAELTQRAPAGLLAVNCLSVVVFFFYSAFNAFAVLLLSVFFVAIALGNTLFGILKMSAALWLGEISYSIYLSHGLVLWALMQHIVPRIRGYNCSAKWFAASSIGITPTVILLCSASYLLVEKPFNHIGHQIAEGKAGPRGIQQERRIFSAVSMG